ncbi:MAG: hypothetical protein KJ792_09945 [Actinobacteria bacterium]|nr:hypothetical protein [Actinomycetota bacterium]MCG2803475.1 hypothetical protein [Cellulomonas sp.]
MDLLLMLAVGALFAVPLVVLVRRPGWGQVADTHPDAARLAADLDAARARAVPAPQTPQAPRAATSGVVGAPATRAAGSRP